MYLLQQKMVASDGFEWWFTLGTFPDWSSADDYRRLHYKNYAPELRIIRKEDA